MKNTKKGTYAFKTDDVSSIRSLPIRTDTWELFFHDLDEKDAWSFGSDLSFKAVADMLCYLGVSRDVSLSDVESLRIDKLDCRGCLYHLYIMTKPLYVENGEPILEEFAVFAYFADELAGVMGGYSADSKDIDDFYAGVASIMTNSVCARSWRVLAERIFPELKEVYARADEVIPEDLQEEILKRMRNRSTRGETSSFPCVLVSDIYIAEDARRLGILTHMMGALNMMFTSEYYGAFYLTPRKTGYDSLFPSLKTLPMFDGYSTEQYQVGVNIAIAKALNMEVVGEERPIAVVGGKKEQVA